MQLEGRSLQHATARMHRSCRGALAPCSARTALPLAHRRSTSRKGIGHQLSLSIRAQAGQLQSQVAVVLGSQWGDEGKGKLVDILAQQYDFVARAQVRGAVQRAGLDCKDGVQQLRWQA